MKKTDGLFFGIFVLIHLLHPHFAWAHGTDSRILGDNKAVTAAFYYSDGEPMSYAKVLVFSPQDQKTEYQNGRTDRQGRFAFYPDTPGIWRIEASDGMGHQAQSSVQVGETKSEEKNAEKEIFVPNKQTGTSSVLLKSITGLSLIFNIFFVMYLWKRKKI
jgi:nickel transport protein